MFRSVFRGATCGLLCGWLPVAGAGGFVDDGKLKLQGSGRFAAAGSVLVDEVELQGGAHFSGYGMVLASLGLGGSNDFVLGDDLTVHATGRIGLQQGFGGAPTATNRFAGSDSFTIAGTPAGGTTVLVDAELSARLAPATDASLGVSGAAGTNGSSAALKARLSGEF